MGGREGVIERKNEGETRVAVLVIFSTSTLHTGIVMTRLDDRPQLK